MTAIRENRTESARVPLKTEQALALLLNAYQRDRFIIALDALNAFGDTCWHSTVAALRKQGIEFEQRSHEHTHQRGGTVWFQAYRLRDEESAQKAAQLLAFYRSVPRGQRRKRRQDAGQGRDTTAA